MRDEVISVVLLNLLELESYCYYNKLRKKTI